MENKINLGHLMLDIETLGNKAGCVITSIGAVECNLDTKEIGRKFYQTVDIQSCLDIGLFVQGETIKWWFEQDKRAQDALFIDTKHIKEVLHLFRLFLNDIGTEELQIWGNSNRFDMGILAAAYYACGNKEIPWKFSNERDVRTLVSLHPSSKSNYIIPVDILLNYPAHHPIHDCLKQIGYCHEIKQLKNNLFI